MVVCFLLPLRRFKRSFAHQLLWERAPVFITARADLIELATDNAFYILDGWSDKALLPKHIPVCDYDLALADAIGRLSVATAKSGNLRLTLNLYKR